MIYDPLTSQEAQKTDGVMLNGHTDFNSVSTLFSQPITALQILMPDGKWRYVRVRISIKFLFPCRLKNSIAP